MKARAWWIGAVLACSLAGAAVAQDGDARRNRGSEDSPEGPRPPLARGEFRGQGLGPGGPLTERWLQRLQETNPEEHARLRALRENNPDGFHQEMRRRLRDELGKKLLREHPAVAQAIQGLPDTERDWLVARLMGSDDRGPRGGGPGPTMGPNSTGGPDPAGVSGRRLDEGDAEIWRLGRAVQETRDGTERARLQGLLREKLDQSFSRKHERRQAELDEMESKLREARAYLQEREKNRAAIIEQRIKELMADPPAPGPRPPPPPVGETVPGAPGGR